MDREPQIGDKVYWIMDTRITGYITDVTENEVAVYSLGECVRQDRVDGFPGSWSFTPDSPAL